MTETTRTPIEGPDPALLTDDEIAEAAMRIAGIGQVLAGTPGESVSAGQLAALDPAPRFICDALQTLLKSCWRRTSAATCSKTPTFSTGSMRS